MQLLEILHDNMGLITWCDIMPMSSSAISPFDWLSDDVSCDINVRLAELRNVTKFEQNCHKFYVFNANFDGYKPGNYCLINKIPCKYLLI